MTLSRKTALLKHFATPEWLAGLHNSITLIIPKTNVGHVKKIAKGVDQRSKDIRGTQQQWPNSPTITLTWSKYKEWTLYLLTCQVSYHRRFKVVCFCVYMCVCVCVCVCCVVLCCVVLLRLCDISQALINSLCWFCTRALGLSIISHYIFHKSYKNKM